MPELNGIEFTEQFRALAGKADTPVLMVTASADRQIRTTAFQHGVTDFLNKPYDSVELQTRVSNALMLRSREHTLGERGSFRTGESSATGPRRRACGGRTSAAYLNMTLQRLAGDEALLGQVARVFVRTVPQLLTSINSALAANDIERVYAEAHSLKGAIAVFEAPEVLNSVIALEKHAVNYNVAEASAAFAVARTLVDRLGSELRPWCRRKVRVQVTGAGPRAGLPPPASHMSTGRGAKTRIALELAARIAQGEVQAQRSAIAEAQLPVETGGNEPACLLACDLHVCCRESRPPNQRFSRHSRKDMRAR